jgi:hypothetical protein
MPGRWRGATSSHASHTATPGVWCGCCSTRLIAFMLMEMNVFRALGEVLGLYSNIAIAWIMTVVADLVINKPLGLVAQGH